MLPSVILAASHPFGIPQPDSFFEGVIDSLALLVNSPPNIIILKQLPQEVSSPLELHLRFRETCLQK